MKHLRYITTLIVFAFILQGCSIAHKFQIINPTDSVWTVEYEILDPRGVFENEITIKGDKSKEEKVMLFEENNIRFEIQPNETARLFWISNSAYFLYQNEREFDEDEKWKDFINIKNIKISLDEKVFELDPSNLEHVFDKNSNKYARINIGKMLTYYAIDKT